MTVQPCLAPDSQLLCPHCRRWHDVIAIHMTGAGYTIPMRYWECHGQRFYTGQDGGTSRFPVRSRATRDTV
jgi:hypothetical protein